jgi:hypothetical protein
MNALCCILLCIAQSAVLESQHAEYTLVNRVLTDYSMIASDAGANIYVISGDLLLKYPPESNTPQNCNLKKHGRPSWLNIDGTNRAVIYFNDNRKVIMLDSLLNESVKPFYLDEIGLFEASIAAGSSDNGLWFYNHAFNAIVKVSRDYGIALKPIELEKHFKYETLATWLVDDNNILYVNEPSSGIYLFNGRDGRFITFHNIHGIFDFQVIHENIYFFRDGYLHMYNQKSRKVYEIEIPFEEQTLNAHWHDQYLILFRNDGFSVYRKNSFLNNN